jgi:hypothetical protein
VHYTNITGEGFRTLNDGEIVRFEVIQGPKGLLAKTVTRVDAMQHDPVPREAAHRDPLHQAEATE